jgi:hypothetical protein
MTLELLIQLLPLIENGITVIGAVIKDLQASGHDPKAPIPVEHQAKITDALAPIAQPLFDDAMANGLGSPEGPEGG